MNWNTSTFCKPGAGGEGCECLCSTTSRENLTYTNTCIAWWFKESLLGKNILNIRLRNEWKIKLFNYIKGNCGQKLYLSEWKMTNN